MILLTQGLISDQLIVIILSLPRVNLLSACDINVLLHALRNKN